MTCLRNPLVSQKSPTTGLLIFTSSDVEEEEITCGKRDQWKELKLGKEKQLGWEGGVGGHYDIMASSLHPQLSPSLSQVPPRSCSHHLPPHTPWHTHSWPVVESYVEYLLKCWTSVQFPASVCARSAFYSPAFFSDHGGKDSLPHSSGNVGNLPPLYTFVLLEVIQMWQIV